MFNAIYIPIYILTRTNLTSRFDSWCVAKGIQPEKVGTDLANTAPEVSSL